jgi:DNA mismatch repair ATPase MutL
MSIQQLSPSCSRKLSSTNHIVEPSNAIKELIDNAIDARATAVTILVAENTLDSIEVKDNGHGIGPDDRGYIGKRHCTSKIRRFEDLESIGGKSLGFRGEALSSLVTIAEMVEVTTRIEGESTATCISVGNDGSQNG